MAFRVSREDAPWSVILAHQQREIDRLRALVATKLVGELVMAASHVRQFPGVNKDILDAVQQHKLDLTDEVFVRCREEVRGLAWPEEDVQVALQSIAKAEQHWKTL